MVADPLLPPPIFLAQRHQVQGTRLAYNEGPIPPNPAIPPRANPAKPWAPFQQECKKEGNLQLCIAQKGTISEEELSLQRHLEHLGWARTH